MEIKPIYQIEWAGREASEAQKAAEKLLHLQDLTDGTEPAFESMEEFRLRVCEGVENPRRALAVGEVREARTLSYNIAERLLEDDINGATWRKTRPSQRMEMMNQAFGHMLDQMGLPEAVRDRVELRYAELPEGVQGKCEVFVVGDGRGGLTLDPDVAPCVTIDPELAFEEDIQLPLKSLLHQAISVMEQTCCTEPAGYFSQQKLLDAWKAEVKAGLDGQPLQAEGAMQRYARSMGEEFWMTYQNLERAKSIRGAQISFL